MVHRRLLVGERLRGAVMGLSIAGFMCGCAADAPKSTGGHKTGDAAGTGFGNSESGSSSVISGGSGNGTTTSSGGGDAGGAGLDTDGLGDCPAVAQGTKNMLQPADIIIGIDTSGSMGEEIALVQQTMNMFSQQIIDSGVDAHVILVAAAGSPDPNAMSNCVVFFPGTPCVSLGGGNFSVCIDAPLGSGMCPDDSKSPTYLHVNQEVGSRDILDVFIAAYPAYKAALRPGALKTFIAISDDNATDPPYNTADAFIAAVNALEPGDPTMWADWNYSGIFCSTQCAAAASIGTVHADLVAKTGGVQGDLCLQDFKPVLDKVAQSVVASVDLACEWAIPVPPMDKVFETDKTNVKVMIDGSDELIGKADSGAACTDKGGWYYDNDTKPTKVVACPATCTRLQDAKDAHVEVLFGCDTKQVDLQ